MFVLVRDHMDTERELVDIGTLPSEIEDTDLRVGDTAVKSRLGKGLKSSQCVRSTLNDVPGQLTLFLQ